MVDIDTREAMGAETLIKRLHQRAPDTVLSPSEAYKIMTPVFGKGIVF